MITEIKEGGEYWSILPSIESVGCANSEPRRPWLGKIIETRYGSQRICSFNPETGVVDDDNNSMAIVRSLSHLYYTKAEAMSAYFMACKAMVTHSENQLQDWERHTKFAEIWMLENAGYRLTADGGMIQPEDVAKMADPPPRTTEE